MTSYGKKLAMELLPSRREVRKESEGFKAAWGGEHGDKESVDGKVGDDDEEEEEEEEKENEGERERERERGALFGTVPRGKKGVAAVEKMKGRLSERSKIEEKITRLDSQFNHWDEAAFARVDLMKNKNLDALEVKPKVRRESHTEKDHDVGEAVEAIVRMRSEAELKLAQKEASHSEIRLGLATVGFRSQVKMRAVGRHAFNVQAQGLQDGQVLLALHLSRLEIRDNHEP